MFKPFLALFALAQVIVANAGVFAPLEQRGFYIGAALALVYLMQADAAPARWRKAAYGALAALAAWTGWHVAWHAERLMDFMADLTTLDMTLGVIAIAVIMDTTRRTTGLTLPVLALVLMAYLFLGHDYVGGSMQPPRFSFLTGIETLYASTSGIFGYMTDVGARVIAVYVVFGALLMSMGAGNAFVTLAAMVAGKSRGGSAKVSVLSSALFGTVSGSAVANVMAVGAVTIPTMTRSGYPRAYAAGVEATASAGGQILPPVMGAGAFLMAELLNVPFSYVALVAIPPAVLYFTAIFISTDFYARRLALRSEASGEIESADLLSWGEVVSLTLPIVVLGWMLFGGYSPTYAGTAATVALMGTAALVRIIRAIARPHGGVAASLLAEARLYLRQTWDGLASGGTGLVTVAVLLACSSILVATLTSSGLAIKISDMLVGLSGDSLFTILLLAAITCILLGMDVPTTASYVLTISVVGPSLIRMGLEPISAHMFVFFFAILSAITPPVCASVYAAATIANENFWKVAGQALRVAGAVYFIPFMFVYRPGVLWMGSTADIVADIAVTAVAVVTFSAASIGYLFGSLGWASRVALFVGSVLLFPSVVWTDYVGAAIIVGTLALNRMARGRADAAAGQGGNRAA
jgi:TRAP transporter 4TM/12TM fusion protein